MRPLPECHWRQGGPVTGLVCESPVVGPSKPIRPTDCMTCEVCNHFAVPDGFVRKEPIAEMVTLEVVAADVRIEGRSIVIEKPIVVRETREPIYSEIAAPVAAEPPRAVPADVAPAEVFPAGTAPAPHNEQQPKAPITKESIAQKVAGKRKRR